MSYSVDTFDLLVTLFLLDAQSTLGTVGTVTHGDKKLLFSREGEKSRGQRQRRGSGGRRCSVQGQSSLQSILFAALQVMNTKQKVPRVKGRTDTEPAAAAAAVRWKQP